nr:hypothetical protein [Tanacetum cinerariifolium]
MYAGTKSNRVLDLEKTKTTQALEITSLKRMVKKLEKKQRSSTYKLKRLYKVGLTARVDSSEDEQSLGKDASKQERKINDIDADEDITLINDQDDVEMFDVNDLHGEEVFVEKEVADKEVNVVGEINAASIATNVSAAATITTGSSTYEKEVAIDDIPLAVKSPRIVDWKIYKKGKKSYYQIVRADRSSKMYMFFRQMLKSFDKEDLYKLVKAKFGSTRPVEDLDLLLWGDLKIMFEPHVEDAVWRKQQGYKVLEWKLYESCGVHSLRMKSMHVYMLVEKKYPLTTSILIDMLNKKLQINYQSEMAYQLLKLIIKQLKNK